MTGTEGTVWTSPRDLAGFAWSPDDAYLALWDAGGTVRCLEAGTWREVLVIPGTPVGAAAWPTAEALWVVRHHPPHDARVIAHAVPDGGVVGVAPMPNAWVGRHAVTVGTGGTVLVAPPQWHLEDRARARVRPAYVLHGDAPVVVTRLDPDALGALPRLPMRRQVRAALSPDGATVALAYGGTMLAVGADAAGRTQGELVTLDWATGRAARVAPGGRLPVDEVLWAGASTVIVRGGSGGLPVDVSGVGEVLVLDTFTARARFDSGRDLEGTRMEGTGGGDGGVGSGAALDLHPDRTHLLVTGRATDPKGTPEVPRWLPALRVVDVGEGTATPLRRLAGKVVPGAGAVWLGEGDALAVLTCRTARAARVDRYASLTARPAGEGLAFTLEGTRPSDVRLVRSPAGRWLTARWQSTPARDAPCVRVAVLPVEALTGQ